LLGEVDRLALELGQTLEGLHAQQLLGFVAFTVHAVVPDGAELFLLGLAFGLALAVSVQGEADLVVLGIVVGVVTTVLVHAVELAVQVEPGGGTQALFGLAIGNLVAVNGAVGRVLLALVELVVVALAVDVLLVALAFILIEHAVL